MSRRVTWVLLAVLVLAPLFGAVGPIRPAYADDPPEEFVIPDGQGSAATPEAEGSPISDDIPAADEDGEEGEEAEESPEPSPTSEPTEEASPTEEGEEEPAAPDATPTAEVETTPEGPSIAEDSGTPVAEPTASVSIDQVKLTINCTSNPERIRVTNNGAAAIIVQSIETLYAPTEFFQVDHRIPAGGTRMWQAGSAATGSYVLQYKLMLTNSAYDKEGVRVVTSAGTLEARCPAAPPPPPAKLSDVKVTINCTSDPEKIRVTNTGKGTFVVQSITTLYAPTSKEPFKVNTTLKSGGTRMWQAGSAASGSYVLTREFILTNTAYDDEGVKVTTSVGTVTKRCPEAPPAPFGGGKWIEVNLSTQYMNVWQGNTWIAGTYVSTGRPGFDTPTGTWYINLKLTSQTMSGCIQGECYYVPDVPWVMYFTNWGHAIHGAYWHNNFGQVMSHGCVNLPVSFAEWLYWWTPMGTPVVVHY